MSPSIVALFERKYVVKEKEKEEGGKYFRT